MMMGRRLLTQGSEGFVGRKRYRASYVGFVAVKGFCDFGEMFDIPTMGQRVSLQNMLVAVKSLGSAFRV